MHGALPACAGPVQQAAQHLASVAEDEAGSSMVEFAASLTLLFSLIFCFMELCLISYTHHMVAELARQGAHYASVHGASCPTTANPTCEVTYSQVNSYVTGLTMPNLGGGTMSVTTAYASTTGGTYTTTGCESVGCSVKVTVAYSFPIMMPFVPKGTPNLSIAGSSVAIIQQ
jgi:Flp pilus assembly protein TadG